MMGPVPVTATEFSNSVQTGRLSFRFMRFLFSFSCVRTTQRFSLVAMSQWYLEGSLNYGARGFQKAASSFAPDALSVVSW